MITKKKPKIKVIQTEDPEEFERQYNEATEALWEKDYEVNVQPFSGVHCAYFYWKETEQIFNLVSDEFHAEGIRYICDQCPLHDPVEDGRKKTVWCKYADYGHTDLRHEACELFYKMLKKNEVKPIY